MKRTALYCVCLLAAEWAAFLALDAFEEKGGHSGGITMAGAFCLPLLSILILCIFARTLRKHASFQQEWVFPLALSGIWGGLSMLGSLAGSWMAFTENFPITQHSGGLTSGWFLNGIEYLFFPILNGVAGVTALLVFTLVIVLRARHRQQNAEKR